MLGLVLLGLGPVQEKLQVLLELLELLVRLELQVRRELLEVRER